MQFDETSKAIADIESRRKAITHASNNEQNAIQEKINEEYKKIGETTFALFDKKEFDLDKIASMLDVVKGLHQTLDEKKAKLHEIQNRYNEELAILKAAIPEKQDEHKKQNVPAGKAACPTCGAEYMPGEMVFCRKCGNKLPENTQNTGTDSHTTAQKTICPKCNAKLLPGAMFCNSCGNKI